MLKNHHDSVSSSMLKKKEEDFDGGASKVVTNADHVMALQVTDVIQEGMTILTEDPLVTFPRFDDFHAGLPICCGCYDTIKEKLNAHCHQCGLLMCSTSCPSVMNHATMECVIFQQVLMKDLVEKLQKTRKGRWKLYMLVSIFRCLQLKALDASKWGLLETLIKFQTNDEKDRVLNVLQELACVGEVLLTAKQVTRSEIHGDYPPLEGPQGHVDMVAVGDTVVAIICCLIKYGVSLWPNNLDSGMSSLLFTTGRILHDCSPNTTGAMDKSGSVKIVASKLLKPGMFLSFSRQQSHGFWFIQGFQYRQPALDYQLLNHDHCSINCTNFRDNDCGINFIKCFVCKSAYFVPLGFSWNCAGCHHVVGWEEIQNYVYDYAKVVEKYRLNSKDVVDDTKMYWDIKRFECQLSPTHFVVLALKTLYMKHFWTYWDKSDEYLRRVISYGEEILDVLQLVAPHLSFFKGSIYFFMHLAHELLVTRACMPNAPRDREYIYYHDMEASKCFLEARKNCDWRTDKAHMKEETLILNAISKHKKYYKCHKSEVDTLVSKAA